MNESLKAGAAGLLFALASNRTAYADPDSAIGTYLLVSAPLVIGVNRHTSVDRATDVLVGVRPQALVARVAQQGPRMPSNGAGAGVFCEAITAEGAETWLGGGVSAVGYLGYLGLVLSVGADGRIAGRATSAVPVVGASFGFRFASDPFAEALHLDMPLGVRVDARPGAGGRPTSLAFQLELDILAVGAALFAASAVPVYAPKIGSDAPVRAPDF